MEQEDKKKHWLRKISFIDILIILIVLVIAVGAIWAKGYLDVEGAGKSGDRIEYQVELKYKEKEFADSIKEGDAIRSSIDGKYLGKLVKKEVVDATNITPDIENEKFVKVKLPDLYDITLTIEANGKVTSQGITAEGEDLKIGKQLYVSGKGYASSSFVVGIDFEEREGE